MTDPPIVGDHRPEFQAVADAFAANFRPTGTADGPADVGELGAALVVLVGGETVLDLAGGWADIAGTRPFQPTSLVNAYSVGKALTAVAVMRLVDDGRLELDRPLTEHWPEFAAGDKHGATLRHALTHAAGVPAIAEPMANDALADWDAMAAAVARTPAYWEPGSAHGYHVNTFGYVAAAAACRVTGSTFPELLRAELTGPVGVADDLFIGTPVGHLDRCVEIDVGGPGTGPLAFPDEGDDRARMLHAAYFNPPSIAGMGMVNSAEWRRASVPSTNGQMTARAVARCYAALLPSASSPLLSGDLLAEATSTQTDGPDLIIGRPTRFGLGFQLHRDERTLGTTPAAFGHYGYGGSLGFADPSLDVAFAFLTARPGDRWQPPRTKRLLAALRSCFSIP